MSPASRSKSKDKKGGKEPEKTPSKPSGPVSGYNPLLGKFHALETSPISTTPLSVNSNGRFRNIDETDDQTANSLVTGIDFDAVSNNGSWSGESEDTKEKTSSSSSTHQASSRQESSVPGADNEKREKIRQKNEKKHQRQKERRAQELHERCSGFLMSRKLEALAQQLVAMGFSSERATMALILNEGKIEESVAWLFEGVEEEEAAVRLKEPNNNMDGGNLKIDITEELAQIVEMEVKYNCSKQEVERAVVACEGDIGKAAETLRLPKEEPPIKPEETVRIQLRPPPPPSPPSLSATASNLQQQQNQQQPPRKEEKNFNYTKAAVPPPMPPPSTKAKLEWAKPQQQVSITMEKRWPNGGGGSTAPTTVQASSPLPAAKVEAQAQVQARYGLLSNELRNLQLGSIKEPVVVMQRPLSSQVIISNQKQQQQQIVVPNGGNINISSSSPSPPPPVSGWHQTNNNNVGGGGGMMMMMRSGAISSSSIHNPSSLVTNKLYSSHLQYQQQQQQQHNHHLMFDDSNQNRGNNNSSWNRMVGASRTTLSAAASLGLFSGLGSNSSSSGSSSPIDWNTSSSMFELDYASVDWSLDRNSRTFGMWQSSNNNNGYQNQNQNPGFGGGGVRPGGGAMRHTNGHPGGYQDSGGVVVVASTTSSSGGEREGSAAVVGGGGGGGSREWASPFEEKDLFTLSRQFVSSPSLSCFVFVKTSIPNRDRRRRSHEWKDG